MIRTTSAVWFAALLALLCPNDASAQPLDCGGVGGTVRSRDVIIPQRGSETRLAAKLFAPDSRRQIAPCPLISMLPGGGAPISSVEWAARQLAANGYVVIITKPSQAASVISYDIAARSGIDFLTSKANPYLAATDTANVGVAGWSLGARALSRTQEEDLRVKAAVAWDNLAVSETGDAGSPACRNKPTRVRTPRVPAMGQASELCRDNASAESKKIAFEHWKSAGQPAMQVVFRNSTHFWWSARGTAVQHELLHYYTKHWFDRWLKEDLAAAARLVARDIAGRPIETVLSGAFRSSAFFDNYNCADVVTACASAASAGFGARSTQDR